MIGTSTYSRSLSKVSDIILSHTFSYRYCLSLIAYRLSLLLRLKKNMSIKSYASIAKSTTGTSFSTSLTRGTSSSTKGKSTSIASSTKPSRVSTPGCPHCRNLGLPFEHWLRESPDPTSKVVCPVLLATECRYCRQLGHTVRSCPKKMDKHSFEQTTATVTPLSPETVCYNIRAVIEETVIEESVRELTEEDLRIANEFSARIHALFTSGLSWAEIDDMED